MNPVFDKTWQFMQRHLLLVVLAVFVFLSLLVFNRVEEDAFIYLRVAENIAEGFGYVFNRGGERIETGSSLFWQLFLVPAVFLPFNNIVTLKLFGVIFGAACFYFLKRSLDIQNKAHATLSLPIFLALCFSGPFLMAVQSGLEPGAYCFLICWYLYFLLNEKFERWIFIPASLVTIGRPEAPVLLFALMVLWFVRKPSRKNLALQLAITICFYFLVTVFRFFYFGDLVVFPFYTKLHTYFLPGFLDFMFFAYQDLYLLGFVVIAIAACHRSFWQEKNIVCLALLAAILVWSVLAIDMKYFYRHHAYWLPVFSLLVVFSLQTLAEIRKESYLPQATIVIAVIYLFCHVFNTQAVDGDIKKNNLRENPIHANLKNFAANPVGHVKGISNRLFVPDSFLGCNWFERVTCKQTYLKDNGQIEIENDYQGIVGAMIGNTYPPGSTIVYDQMGQTPYYAGHEYTFIDITGLTYKPVGYARFENRQQSTSLQIYQTVISLLRKQFLPERKFSYSNEEIIDQVFAAKPDVLLMWPEKARQPFAKLLGEDPRFEQEYELAYGFNFIQQLYERKDKNYPPLDPQDNMIVVDMRTRQFIGNEAMQKLGMQMLKNAGIPLPAPPKSTPKPGH